MNEREHGTTQVKRTWDSLAFFSPFCTSQFRDQTRCYPKQQSIQTCYECCDRLNALINAGEVRDKLGVSRAIVTCPSQSKDAALHPQFFYNVKTLFPEYSQFAYYLGLFYTVNYPLITDKIRSKGVPVIIPSKKAIGNDNRLVHEVFHELVHARDFLSHDKYTYFLYLSPFRYFNVFFRSFFFFLLVSAIWAIDLLLLDNYPRNLAFLLLDLLFRIVYPLIFCTFILNNGLELRTEIRAFRLSKEITPKTNRKDYVGDIILLIVELIVYIAILTYLTLLLLSLEPPILKALFST